MKKAYVTVSDNIQLHYRTAGTGQPIVIFHPSPRSSKMMIPFGTLLSEYFQVVMPDLFGYGGSDALPLTVNTLYDYLPYLKAAFDSLGLNKFAIYGSATGAQLGIAYALTYPDDVSCLFLDNAAHFEDAERADILANYFPEWPPQYNGSHLTEMWSHVVDSTKYFPWYDAAKPLNLPEAPANILTDILTDYLIAGTGYATAYRAAFAHEKAENVQNIKVKTLIFKWLQSPLLPYIEKLLTFPMPENVSVFETNGQERTREMVQEIKKNL